MRAKEETISLRVSPEVKRLLRRAAEKQNRSLTNLLVTLLLEHCRANGIGTDAEELTATDIKG